MNHKRGFTLIELMVTVAILAILAGIAFPTYRFYRDKAAVSSALSAVAATRDAVQLYLIEHGNLNGLTVAAEGGPLTAEKGALGVSFPQKEGMTWQIQVFNSPLNDKILGCSTCDAKEGKYYTYDEFSVDGVDDLPKTYIYTGADDKFGLNTPGIEELSQTYGFTLDP